MSSPNPLHHQITINGAAIILQWREIREEMDLSLWSSLTDDEKAIYSRITHSDRKREWSEGRRTLALLPPAYRFTSLAHSEKWILAAGTEDRPLGVDLELGTRVISNRLEKWIEHDPSFTQSPLETWLVKEACFKADRNENDGLVLSDYAIESASRARALKGRARDFSFQLFANQDWRFALALAD